MPQFPGQATPVAPPPPPPAPPATATSATTVAPAPMPPGATPQEVYQAYRAQRRELINQRDALLEQREDMVQEAKEGTISETDRAGIDQRLVIIDQQLAAKQVAIAEAEAQVAVAAGVPGAASDPPRPPDRFTAEDVFEVGALIFTILAIPIVLAWARRIWRKSSVTINLPAELSERIGGMERSIDTIAVEVERIGEGQRFVTQLMAGRAQPAEQLARGRGEGHV